MDMRNQNIDSENNRHISNRNTKLKEFLDEYKSNNTTRRKESERDRERERDGNKQMKRDNYINRNKSYTDCRSEIHDLQSNIDKLERKLCM